MNKTGIIKRSSVTRVLYNRYNCPCLHQPYNKSKVDQLQLTKSKDPLSIKC